MPFISMEALLYTIYNHCIIANSSTTVYKINYIFLLKKNSKRNKIIPINTDLKTFKKENRKKFATILQQIKEPCIRTYTMKIRDMEE